jgi:hypothetical protein
VRSECHARARARNVHRKCPDARLRNGRLRRVERVLRHFSDRRRLFHRGTSSVDVCRQTPQRVRPVRRSGRERGALCRARLEVERRLVRRRRRLLRSRLCRCERLPRGLELRFRSRNARLARCARVLHFSLEVCDARSLLLRIRGRSRERGLLVGELSRERGDASDGSAERGRVDARLQEADLRVRQLRCALRRSVRLDGGRESGDFRFRSLELGARSVEVFARAREAFEAEQQRLGRRARGRGATLERARRVGHVAVERHALCADEFVPAQLLCSCRRVANEGVAEDVPGGGGRRVGGGSDLLVVERRAPVAPRTQTPSAAQGGSRRG